MTSKEDKLLILYKPEQKQFEKHPGFHKYQRRDFFVVSERLEKSLKKFRGPAKAMLFVKYVYFRTHNKFYETFSPKDIARAEKVLNMEPETYELNKRTMNRIEKEILSIFNFERLPLFFLLSRISMMVSARHS